MGYVFPPNAVMILFDSSTLPKAAALVVFKNSFLVIMKEHFLVNN
jgi:hypothetical protein